MIDRSIAPELSAIESISFVAPDIVKINHQVNLYHMKDVTNETSRFDLYFDAGKIRGEHSIASFVSGLLLTGTPEKSAVQIQEEINALGGFMENGLSAENSVVSMYCLRENLKELFEILIDAINNVAFFDDEVTDLLSDRKQKLEISREKVSYLAQANFQQQLFGSDQRYSQIIQDEDFDLVTIEKLKAFHKDYYLNGLERVVIVGDISEDDVQSIVALSKQNAQTKKRDYSKDLKNATGLKNVPKDGALQSAIRVGRTLFNKNHEDYLDFLVLNTILGDYFGSRLMSNIREDKGYTYGIGSMLAELNDTGYFLIATEVGADVRDNAIIEIKNELERLQNELVSESELELVKNYMRGQLLKSADGPYAMTDLYLSVILHGKDLEFYNEALASLNEITPKRLQELAQKYLSWDNMSIVTAG